GPRARGRADTCCRRPPRRPGRAGPGTCAARVAARCSTLLDGPVADQGQQARTRARYRLPVTGIDGVVIVGAGPVGLFLAAELRLADLDVTVLERRTERPPITKGVAMHARTLELLAMRGLAGTFLHSGV